MARIEDLEDVGYRVKYDDAGKVVAIVGSRGEPSPFVLATTNLTGGIELLSGGVSTKLDLSTDVVAGVDSVAIQAALDNSVLKTKRLNPADYTVSSTVKLGSPRTLYPDTMGQFGVDLIGAGPSSTKITSSVINGPALEKDKQAQNCGVSGLALFGPGKSNTDSIGIAMNYVGAGNGFSDLTVHGFGYGHVTHDQTLVDYHRVAYYHNAVGFAQGYVGDVHSFYSCRFQNNDVAFYDGYTSGSTPNESKETTWIGNRYGENGLVFKFEDVGAKNKKIINGYFEYNRQIALIGKSGQGGALRGLSFDGCSFTRQNPITQGSAQIELVEKDAVTSLSIKNCYAPAAFANTFLKIGLNTILEWDGNLITKGAPPIIRYENAAGNQAFDIDVNPEKHTIWFNKHLTMYADGGLLGSYVPFEVKMKAGIGKTYAKFDRLNSTDGSILGAGASIVDIDGKYATWAGAVKPAAVTLPSATAALRGVTVRVEGGAGVSDKLYCCMKSSSDTYSWVQVASA